VAADLNFDWYGSNVRVDYPFTHRITSPAGLHELFVDAVIVHNQTGPGDVLLTSFNPAGDAVLRFSDASLLASLTAADGFNSRIFGAYTVLTWRRNEVNAYGVTGDELEVRFVLLTAKLADFSFPIAPVDARFDASLVIPRIARVKRLNNQWLLPLSFTGAAVLQAGYNVKLEVVNAAADPLGFVPAQTDVRAPTVIQISAVPGAGMGRSPVPFSPTPEIRTINGVGPDASGNLQLEGRDCFWVERPLRGAPRPPVHPGTDYDSDVTEAQLKIRNNCLPCCDCSDYINMYRQLRLLWDRAKTASRKIHDALAKYNRLNQQVCASRVVKAILKVYPRPGSVLSTTVEVRNDSIAIVSGLITLDVTFAYSPNVLAATYLPSSGILDAEGSRNVITAPTKLPATETFRVVLPTLGVGRYARYSFEASFARISGGLPRPSVNITVSALVTWGGGTATASTATRLLRPGDKA